MRAVGTFVFILTTAFFAFAFPADIMGLNPTSQGLVGALSSRVIGPAGVFYNPATLAFLERWELELGYLSGNPWLDLQLKDKEGNDLDDTDIIKETKNTPGFQNVNFGVGGAINKWVGFGSYMSLNVDGNLRDSVITPQTPYWLKWENALVGQQIFLGFGVKILPNLSLGGAALLLADGDGSGKIETYPPNQFEPTDEDAITSLSLTGSSKIISGATFIAGIYYRAAEFVSVGLAFRGPLMIERAYRHEIEVPGEQEPVPIKVTATTNFSPAEIHGGFTASAEWVSFSFELAYTLWSQYKYPFPKIEVGPIGKDEKAQRWDPQIDTYDFGDVVSVRTGVEFTPVKHWHLAIGYSYEPSPLTETQKGTTNVLDSSASIFGFSTGGDIPLTKSTILELEAGIKYFLTDDYKIEKDDAEMNEDDPEDNPFYPICEVTSDFYAFSISARFLF